LRAFAFFPFGIGVGRSGQRNGHARHRPPPFKLSTSIGGISVLISNAYAQAAPASQGFDLFQMLPLVLMFVLLYFLMIRPQSKRAKEHKAMLSGLQKGDEVVTAGGTLGRVTKVGDNFVSVEIAPNVEIQVQRSSITTLLPKGTVKSADKG
jgi:preprotein translocase subunit YajC